MTVFGRKEWMNECMNAWVNEQTHFMPNLMAHLRRCRSLPPPRQEKPGSLEPQQCQQGWAVYKTGWVITEYLRQVLKEESAKPLPVTPTGWWVLIQGSTNCSEVALERLSLVCYYCSSYWFILCSWIIFKKFMAHFYGNSQSCISLECIARSWRQEETDGFSIIDVNELPSVASLRNAIRSKSPTSGSVHTHTKPH